MHAACLDRNLARFNAPGQLSRAAGLLKEFGPYVLIEMVLPGGSLVAGTLWYLQHKDRPVAVAMAIAFVTLLVTGVPAV